MHVCVHGAFAMRAANEEPEPCQHLPAGLPCATWIMSADNESCAESQHHLWDPLPPSLPPSLPPLPRAAGACRGAGLLSVSPGTVLPSGLGTGTDGAGLVIWSSWLVLGQLWGPAVPSALPLVPGTGAMGGRTGNLRLAQSCCGCT